MGFEHTTLVVKGTDCIGSCKSNYHAITTTTALRMLRNKIISLLHDTPTVTRVPVKCETKSKRNETKRNEIETKRGKFRFFSVNFVSIYFVSFRFVSFRFRFAFYRYTHKDAVFQWCLLDSKSNWHNFHIFSSFYFIFSQSKNRITNQLHVFNPTKQQRELPFNLKKGEGGMSFFL